MKKTIFILLASALAFAFVSCDEKVTEIYAESSVSQFEVTSSYVVFGAVGGSKTVLVTTNLDWNCSSDASWFSYSTGDGTILINADANESGAARYGELTVSASDGSKYFTETISVAQRVAEDDAIDLSAEECSNSYMVSTGTSYRFNASVKGNGISQDLPAIKAYIDLYGVEIDPADVVFADLLWEATLDADKTRSRNIIDEAPIYDNGYIWFTTGEAEGNAVIAVKDANGNILWSWHIWVTDQNVVDIEGNGHLWMDRNLGANSTEELDVTNRGLLYQWGRKDPFLPSSSAYGDENAAFNTQVGDGSGTWNYTNFPTKLESTAPGNIPLAVKNPMSVLLINGSIYSWYLTLSNDENRGNYMWGNSSDLSTYIKSIFDPCPVGYTVPVDNPWLSSKDQDVNYWSVDADYGRYWTGGNDAYYPCAGAFNGSTGSFTGVSTYGYYWSGGMPSATSYYGCDIYFTPATTIYYSSTYPLHAMSVRCMRTE